jgi:serine/threonine protein phosphatase 1
MKRNLVIGDIHGGLKALQQILISAKVTQEDTLIFLGDYVDGWSETAQLIDFLIELDQNQKCIFILGNHDIWCKEWLKNNIINEKWNFHGGKSTIKSYENYTLEQKLKHLIFFETMKDYFVDGDNNLFMQVFLQCMVQVRNITLPIILGIELFGKQQLLWINI